MYSSTDMSIYLHNSTLIHAHTYSLSCARVLTTPCTCCHPCFHTQKCSKDPRRCWCALSSQEKSQVKDAACVQLNAPLPLVCLCARTRKRVGACVMCVCLSLLPPQISVCVWAAGPFDFLIHAHCRRSYLQLVRARAFCGCQQR